MTDAEALRDGRFVIVGSLGEGVAGPHVRRRRQARGARGRHQAIRRSLRQDLEGRRARRARGARPAVALAPAAPEVPRPLRARRRALPRDGEDRGREPRHPAEARRPALARRTSCASSTTPPRCSTTCTARAAGHPPRPQAGQRHPPPDGSFAFVDFGAVRDKLRPEGGSTIVGTFGYMAPEQFQGRALPASDVYAIGATALSMLTGRQPEDLPHKGLAIDVRAALGRSRQPAPRRGADAHARSGPRSAAREHRARAGAARARDRAPAPGFDRAEAHVPNEA